MGKGKNNFGSYVRGMRGPIPTGRVPKWTADLAYVVGLMASDGCLGEMNGYMNFTSKDKEMVLNVKRILQRKNVVGTKRNQWGQSAYVLQWKDVILHQWFISIGITPRKSKTIRSVTVPKKYFLHFVRGLWDGDGTVYSYKDPRWGTHMFYVGFSSASAPFLEWLQLELHNILGVKGHMTVVKAISTKQLRYAKKEAALVLKAMFGKKGRCYLKRKFAKAKKILTIEARQVDKRFKRHTS